MPDHDPHTLYARRAAADLSAAAELSDAIGDTAAATVYRAGAQAVTDYLDTNPDPIEAMRWTPLVHAVLALARDALAADQYAADAVECERLSLGLPGSDRVGAMLAAWRDDCHEPFRVFAWPGATGTTTEVTR
jgi:hypothetical protein